MIKTIILSIILVCLTSALVFCEIPTFTKIVPANMTLEGICKHFLEIRHPSVVGTVRYLNANQIYFNAGEQVVLPEIITAMKVYFVDIEGKTCAELAEQAKCSERLFKIMNPDVVCQ